MIKFIYIYIYILLIIFLLNNSLSYIVLPFEIYVEKYIPEKTEQPYYNISRLLNEWFSFKLFSKIKIANPAQEISVFINPQKSCLEFNRFNSEGLNIDKLSYFFSDEEKPINLTLYNLTSSNTFIDVSNKYSRKYDSYNYLVGNDEIYLYNNFNEINSKNIIISNNLSFLVNTNDYFKSDCRKTNCGLYIGMPIFNQEDNCPNFNKELKNSNLINKYIFSIHFDSNKSGSLILGAYPHEYLKEKYKEEQLSTFYTKPDEVSSQINNFNIFADKIISKSYDGNEIQISNNTKIIFEFYYGFFIGTYSYQEFIEKNFFNDLISEGICNKANRTTYGMVMYFDLYSCKEENLDEIKKFPELKFYLKNSDTSFIFNFNDLFIKIGKRFYFLVIFEKYQRSFWEVGFPFYRKYDIVFDEDNKIISYYNTNKQIEKEETKNETFKIVVIIILTIILICLILSVGFYFGKLKYMQRKKRANEMNDDDYDYSASDKIINNETK